MRKTLFCLFIVILSNYSAFSQLTVTDGNTAPYTPENLISNVFLGEGVEVTNVTYSGDARSVGYFAGGNSFGFGIERGVILTSGFAATGGGNNGADNNGSVQAGNDSNSSATDVDMTTLATGSVNDLCKYTISFIPTSDTLRFEYIFASEEYPEYVCQFNDIFSFIISGPGISGPFENGGENIAIVPGTNIPVTIDNVHETWPNCPAMNPQFYNDNNGSNSHPVYDGYLDVFVAQAVVIPCQEYTIKLMISDVGDSAFDSGVFLAAKSFGTGSIDVETATVSLDGTITEGCAQGILSFKLPNAPLTDLAVDYNVFGTAINGVDYESIPLDLTFPAGVDSIGYVINAYEDGILEGVESIGIDIQRDICNRDTFYFYIKDTQIVPPELNNDTIVCEGNSVQLYGALPIALPDPPSFTSTNEVFVDTSTIPFYSPITVFGVEPFILEAGVIQSVCINLDHIYDGDMDIYLIAPSGQFLELTTDNGGSGDNYVETCFTYDATTPIVPPGMLAAPNSAAPFTGNWIPEGVWSDLWSGDNVTNGVWQLLMIDDGNGFDTGHLIDWTITFSPLYQIKYNWTPTTGLSCIDCPEPIATPLTTTTYHLTATDSYGCLVEDSIVIEVIDNLDAPDITCSSTGPNQITATWSSIPGATNYILTVNGGTPINLPSTTNEYVVNGVGGNTEFILESVGGCDVLSDTTVCCLAPNLSISSMNNESCFGANDGQVQINTVGGTGSFNFDIGGGINNTTGLFDGLQGGNYTITVSDQGGCVDSIEFSINPALDIVSHFELVDSISCFNESDGEVSVVIDNGSFPMTYQWSNLSVDSNATNLSVGWNFITITDANSCTHVDSILLDQPLELTTTIDKIDALCFGDNNGKSWVSPIGGTGPYTYLWSANTGSQTLDTAINLVAGAYSVTITDAHSCDFIENIMIDQPAIITSQISMNQAFCTDSGDGTATVNSQGGVGSLTYLWDDPMMQTTATITGLNVGWVHVSITDENNCMVVDSIEITAPNQLVVSSLVEPTNCFNSSDGQVSLTINGGSPNYSVLWSDIGVGPTIRNDLSPGPDSVIVSDMNGCSQVHYFNVLAPDTLKVSLNPTPVSCFDGNDGEIMSLVEGGIPNYSYLWDDPLNQTGNIANGLGAGIYSLTVLDDNNCEVSEVATVENATPILLETNKTDVTCFDAMDGQATVNVISGGTGNYSYVWSDVNAQTSNTANNLDVGTYMVSVMDDNSCLSIDTIEILGPSIIQTVLTKTDINCNNDNNGSISVESSGGTGTHTYLWSTMESNNTIEGLGVGTYYLTTTDENDCFVIDTVNISTEDPILFSAVVQDVSCFGAQDGSISYTVSGGITPYKFRYNGVEGSQQQSSLSAQIYNVEIEDGVGCIVFDTVSILEPEEMIINEIITPVSCKGETTGAIDIEIQSQIPVASISWNSNNFTSNDEDISNLPAGTYYLVVEDDNGCIKTGSYVVSEPDRNMTLTAEVIDVSCAGETDGQIGLNVEGGTPEYMYDWSNGMSSQLITDLGAGTHNVTVSDGRGCTVDGSYEVNEPSLILSSYTKEDVTCFESSDGRIDVLAQGGTMPYSFYDNSSFVNFNGSILGVDAGEHILYLIDANGCQHNIDTVSILGPDPLIVDLGPDITIDLEQSTTINAIIPNGEVITLYEWMANSELLSNDASVFVTPQFTTVYSVKVTDEKGCIGYDDVIVNIDKERQIHIPLGFSPNNDGVNDYLLIHGKPGTLINDFSIFDKWGELVYKQNGTMVNDDIGWDGNFKGTALPSGVYVWKIDVTFIDGLNAQFKGQTTLIK